MSHRLHTDILTPWAPVGAKKYDSEGCCALVSGLMLCSKVKGVKKKPFMHPINPKQAHSSQPCESYFFKRITLYIDWYCMYVLHVMDSWGVYLEILFLWIDICNASRAMRTKNKSKIFFVLILFSLFILFFGAPSLQNFLREPILVEIDREELEDMEFPRVSFCPFERSSESWIKGSEPDMFWIQNLCTNDSFEKVRKAWQQAAGIYLFWRFLNVSMIVYFIWMKASAMWPEAGAHRPASPWPRTSGAPLWPMSASATLSSSGRGWALTSTLTASLLASRQTSFTGWPFMTQPSLRFAMCQQRQLINVFYFFEMSANNEVHPGIQLHYRTQSPGTLLKISLKVCE